MLEQIIRRYLDLYPDEVQGLKVLIKQAVEDQQLYGRLNYEGHVTGSGIVLSPDRKKILLIYHPTFKRWQQPGGHWEADEPGPWSTAKRETQEETGVELGPLLSLKAAAKFVPIQIDSHLVPTTPPKNEPLHYHHDFRYGFVARNEDLQTNDDVIKEARWVDIAKLDGPLKTAVRRTLEVIGD